MKVPISDHAHIDLSAPVLTAEPVEVDGVTKYRVWCKHCEIWHFHGPMEGHRIAHCTDPASPYWKTGYNLARADIA